MSPKKLGTYALLCLWTPIYLFCFGLICVARGIWEEFQHEWPKEWRMIKNSWRSVGTLLVVCLILSGCAQTRNVPPIENVPRVEFNMQTGSISIVSKEDVINLGRVKRDGSLEIAESASGTHYAVALLIMIQANAGPEWTNIVKGLPQ